MEWYFKLKLIETIIGYGVAGVILLGMSVWWVVALFGANRKKSK